MTAAYSLTAEEVAQILRVGKGTVYRLAHTGELPSYKIDRKLRFSLNEVERYLSAQEHTGAPSSPAAEQLYIPEAFALDTRAPFVFAGGGPTSDPLSRFLAEEGFPIRRLQANSYTALINLYAGAADAAFIHLYDSKTNSYNVPYVQRLVPGLPVLVIRLISLEQGFIVERSNRKKITNWSALLRPGVRLVNRERGSESRILLDEKLIAMEAVPDRIEGYQYELTNGNLAAQEIAIGAADVAVGTPHDIMSAKVDFVPLQKGWVDVVAAKNERTADLVRAIRRITASDHFKAALEKAGGDTSRLGAIQYEC